MKLVHIKRPILRIPSLAIHLQTATIGKTVNKEQHTTPIMATELPRALNASTKLNSAAAGEKESISNAGKKATVSGSAESRHPSTLLGVLALELDIDASQIVDLDLCVTDTQPAAIGGARNQFVFAPRLDNLASCFTRIKSLINSLETETAKDLGSVVKLVALYDHEEVGSSSSHGAASPMIEDSIRRITVLCAGACYHRAIRCSILVSADMAHALHPNYTSVHEGNHRPKMGAGMVLKTNANQRYATSGITGLIFREVARRAGNLPLQEFVVGLCGSTIGPIVSSITGLRSCDVGAAQLSMHSVREMCSVVDFDSSEKIFRAFFSLFREIDVELAETAD